MKIKLFLLIGVAALLATVSQAQNPAQELIDSAVQNGAVGGGFWRGTTGNKNIASYDYLYNINPQTNSLSAGLILGGDYMFGGGSAPTWNDVKGGFAIKYQFNLGAIGFTNTILQVYAGTAVATPRTSGVGVGNITFTGIDYHFTLYKKVLFHIDPAYQSRAGQGSWDGSYLGVQAFFSLGDGGASTVAYNDLYQRYALAQSGFGEN